MLDIPKRIMGSILKVPKILKEKQQERKIILIKEFDTRLQQLLETGEHVHSRDFYDRGLSFEEWFDSLKKCVLARASHSETGIILTYYRFDLDPHQNKVKFTEENIFWGKLYEMLETDWYFLRQVYIYGVISRD